MKIYTFIADSAPEAVAQIRSQLGSEAVVLNVRKIEANGIGKLWKKPQIEVLAHLPETPVPSDDPLHALTELRREIADLKQQMPLAQAPAPVVAPIAIPESMPPASRIDYGGWKVGTFLEQTGILPRNVQRIIDHVVEQHGPDAPEALGKQLDLARAGILNLCRSGAEIQSGGKPHALQKNVAPDERASVLECARLGAAFHSAPAVSSTHIFIGPPGCGKTTVLSKLLARRVLLENLPAHVFRLDGLRANTAESLSVYCEILGVPVERCRADATQSQATETNFIDIPGISPHDLEGLKNLASHVTAFPGAQIHLTLNAAYETTTLINQFRAFSVLPVTDIIFTHLDEEQRYGKFLNFCFGIKVPIAYLSAGQNVPGDLDSASLEKIVSRVIPSK
jgi:flagellar biosynthesis protein FlhF